MACRLRTAIDPRTRPVRSPKGRRHSTYIDVASGSSVQHAERGCERKRRDVCREGWKAMPSTRIRPRREVADEALVRSLFAEHGRAMLGYATHLTRERAAAEDVVQEALVRAWRHPDSLVNGKGSVRGWLLTVVRNIVTDQIRARNARAIEV